MSTFQNKIRNRIGFINKKSYEEFKNKYPNSQITLINYISILKESTSCIRDCILTNELGFKIPYNLGYIAVDKFKQKEHYIAVDWLTSKKHNKLIPLTNFHSFGYMYKVKFFRNNRNHPTRTYMMQAHRILKRMLAKKIKEGNDTFIPLDPAFFNKRFSIDRIIKNDK